MNFEIDLKETLNPQPSFPFKNLNTLSLNILDLNNLLSKISSEPYDPSPFFSIETSFDPIIDEDQLPLIAQDQPYLIEVINSIEKVAREHLKGLDPLKIESFSFVLPPTVFKKITKEMKVIKNIENDPEYIETSSLTWGQRCEIFRTGRFTVKSYRFKQDYVWKMSDWIIKGRVHINESLIENMKDARKMLKDWWKAIYRANTHGIRQSNIVNGFVYFWEFIRNLVSIFVGYPKIYQVLHDSTSYFVSDYYENLERDEEIDQSLWKYFFEKKKNKAGNLIANENLVYLRGLEGKFEIYWTKQKIIEEKNLENNELLKRNLMELYYKQMSQFLLEKNEKLSPEKLKKLLEFYKCLQIIQSQVYIHDNLFFSNLQNYNTNLKETHSFLTKFDCYLLKKQEEFTISEQKKLENLRNSLIIQEFTLKNFPEQLSLFTKFLKFLEYFQENHSAANFLLTEHKPYRIIKFTIQLFPGSWKVESSTNHINETRYSLIRTETLLFSTDHCFWRIFIMLVRYRVWVQNAMYWLFVMAIASPLGIRALCGISPFYPDKECDEITGEIRPAVHKKVQTVISTFLLVLKSIKDDRGSFEAQPDTGFFGKKFNRIFNLVYNYIFKLFFIGFFLVIICLPILIVFNVFFSLFLSVSACLWMPIILILVKIWQIFLFDNDNERSQNGGSNTFEVLPLFSELLITFGYHCLFQIFFAVFLLILKPILFVLIIVLGILRYILRSFYDVFMMLFVWLFGRVPASDTSIAFKISGPVVSQKFFDKISVFDGLKAYIGALERIELNQYEEEIKVNLKKNYTEVMKFYRDLNMPFGISTNMNNYDENHVKKKENANLMTLQAGELKLVQKLNGLLQERRLELADNHALHNARFNKTNLESFKDSCKEVLKTFINRRNMRNHWKNVDFLDENEVDKINGEMMRSSINSNILEPFEEIDERAELYDKSGQLFGVIDDVLQGKKGNENENLEIRMVKNKEEKAGIKYLPVENSVHASYLGGEQFGIGLENSIRVNVYLKQTDRKQAERLKALKEMFKEVDK